MFLPLDKYIYEYMVDEFRMNSYAFDEFNEFIWKNLAIAKVFPIEISDSA